jgi:hypothetical protein
MSGDAQHKHPRYFSSSQQRLPRWDPANRPARSAGASAAVALMAGARVATARFPTPRRADQIAPRRFRLSPEPRVVGAARLLPCGARRAACPPTRPWKARKKGDENIYEWTSHRRQPASQPPPLNRLPAENGAGRTATGGGSRRRARPPFLASDTTDRLAVLSTLRPQEGARRGPN